MTAAQSGQKKDTENHSYYTQREPPLPLSSTHAENPTAGEGCSSSARAGEHWQVSLELYCLQGIQLSFRKGHFFPAHAKSYSKHSGSHCINRTCEQKDPKTVLQPLLLLMLEHSGNIPLPRKLRCSTPHRYYSDKKEKGTEGERQRERKRDKER